MKLVFVLGQQITVCMLRINRRESICERSSGQRNGLITMRFQKLHVLHWEFGMTNELFAYGFTQHSCGSCINIGKIEFRLKY
ncbi:hypothetical protein H5410_059646 [Solanum commersonii]|uniref:Uncharacterized protein n=1 Tax=Solanum commersonii TaxID=4109 RepID=A0A9J5W3J9_SOLCO|nr:hypothetical protein H5410_059646 [Solanum commersonii]